MPKAPLPPAAVSTIQPAPPTPKVPDKVIINPPRLNYEQAEAQKKSEAKAKVWAKEKIGIDKELKDPFQVDFPLTKKGEGPEKSENLEKRSFVLQGVIVGASRSVALIDDNVFELGDYFNGWKLVGIKKDRVGLKKGKEAKKLQINLGGVSDGK